MPTLSFSEEDLRAIAHDRYHHPDPRVQQKMEVLWLTSHGLTTQTHAEHARDPGDVLRDKLSNQPASAAASLKDRLTQAPALVAEGFASAARPRVDAAGEGGGPRPGPTHPPVSAAGTPLP